MKALTLIAILACALATGVAGAGTAALPRLLSCTGSPLLRPAGTVVLACADANTELTKTHWRTWDATSATGITDFGVNLCTPSCAQSRIRFFPGSAVRLVEPRRTSKGLVFTRAVITYRLHGSRRTFVAYPATR